MRYDKSRPSSGLFVLSVWSVIRMKTRCVSEEKSGITVLPCSRFGFPCPAARNGPAYNLRRHVSQVRLAFIGLVFAAFGVSACKPPDNNDQTTVTLRVLTYNIHHGAGESGEIDLERIAAVIRSVDPDVVTLQEVDQGTERASGVMQAEKLGELTGLDAYFSESLPYGGGSYGNAILTRLPVNGFRRHFLPNAEDHEPRSAGILAVEANGVPIRFVSTHFNHRSAELRLEQARELRRLLGTGNGATIVAGDLNATPESAVLESLQTWLAMAFAENPEPTSPARNPKAKIDYVLMDRKSAWTVLETRVLEESEASDHRAVLAVLELKK